jgi:hypothetical protein
VDITAAHKRLDDIVASFTTHSVEQNATDRDAKGETAKQQQLRVTLSTDSMRPIAEIARRNLRSVPDFKALQMPRKVVGKAFLASAKGMATAATVHQATLIERGLPADFLEHFQTAITTFETSVNDREKSRTQRMGATQALVAQEQEGRSTLKVLDALVRRALRGNPALLGTWEGARAIHRRPGGGQAATPPKPVTPAPVTTATPTGTPASSTSASPVQPAA